MEHRIIHRKEEFKSQRVYLRKYQAGAMTRISVEIVKKVQIISYVNFKIK